MSILEDLYLGKLRPLEKPYSHENNSPSVIEKCEEITEALKSFIPKNKRNLLNELCDCCAEASFEFGKENFISGFTLGVRLTVECLSENKNQAL